MKRQMSRSSSCSLHMHLLLASTFAVMADLVLLFIDLFMQRSCAQKLLPPHCYQESVCASFCDLQLHAARSSITQKNVNQS